MKVLEVSIKLSFSGTPAFSQSAFLVGLVGTGGQRKLWAEIEKREENGESGVPSSDRKGQGCPQLGPHPCARLEPVSACHVVSQCLVHSRLILITYQVLCPACWRLGHAVTSSMLLNGPPPQALPLPLLWFRGPSFSLCSAA